MSFYITTDSGCDLADHICKENDIIALKMPYTIDGQQFTDTMLHEDCKKFYDKMREDAVPKTSQINPVEFVDFWRPLLDKKIPILHISLGSGISGAYANALIAAQMVKDEYPENEILVLDSTLASVGYGILCLKAAEMRSAGKTVQECFDWLETNKIHMNTYYTTSELKYLYRSGRVSKAGAVVGTMLNIMPILRLDKYGHLLVMAKQRGKKATIAKLTEIIQEAVIDPQEQTLYICHSDVFDEAQAFGEGLKETFGFKDIFYTYIGATIGSHSGPGL